MASPRQSTCIPPSAPVKPLAHYVFLVHGYLGNDLEMGALSLSFRDFIAPAKNDDGRSVVAAVAEEGDASGISKASRERAREPLTHERAAAAATAGVVGGAGAGTAIVVHSAKCNVGRTHDGVRRGGARLAREVLAVVRADAKERVGAADGAGHATFSFVGNSLGGLYSRYALALLPQRIQLRRDDPAPPQHRVLHLHPNVFCTTVTPHLGVSRHTYVPLPRFAETIFGVSMGTTGRDLFRLDGFGNRRGGNDVAGEVAATKGDGQQEGSSDEENVDSDPQMTIRRLGKEKNDDLQCLSDEDDDPPGIVRDMCLQERFLVPLRSFRQRIAYANAYGTDFQVPMETAAFLHEQSEVGHVVVATRCAVEAGEERESTTTEKAAACDAVADDKTTTEKGDGRGPPPFIVAVVRTERTSPPQWQGDGVADELLWMSRALDALGWTKVFVDIRDCIPAPTVTKPRWLRRAGVSLDDLVRPRLCEEHPVHRPGKNIDIRATANVDATEGVERVLTSRELALSARWGDTMNFPLGHTVMTANSKNQRATRVNGRGRPVMDYLAKEMVCNMLEFK